MLKCYFCYSFLEYLGIFFLKKAYFTSIIFEYYIFKVCLHIGYKEEKRDIYQRAGETSIVWTMYSYVPVPLPTGSSDYICNKSN